MERRSFLKEACRVCLLGNSLATALASCSPTLSSQISRPEIKENKIQIPLSLFNNHSFQVISPLKYPYEISLEKKAENDYVALLLRCTHFNNPLTVSGNGFTCSLHGSKFDQAGIVLKGPAEQSLQRLSTRVVKDQLWIQL